MAKPRVFVSSTYYDLKHLRSSLDLFIESLGFEPVLSEKGDIAFTSESPLDESCYREASSADIFVLIIGGRYGSEASGKDRQPTRSFFDRYESITKKEYESAVTRDIPVYVLVESSVHSEYQTYLRNKDAKAVNYAHVDSVNVFRLIEEILARPRNNPMHTFERFSDIESWLREQWAGLFRELLQRQSQQEQLTTLTSQVSELRGINETLRRYLEAVMKGITPDASSKLIQTEQKRLQELERRERIRANRWSSFALTTYGIDFENLLKAVRKATSFKDYAKLIGRASSISTTEQDCFNTLKDFPNARRDLNELRTILGLKPFRLRKDDENNQTPAAAETKSSTL